MGARHELDPSERPAGASRASAPRSRAPYAWAIAAAALFGASTPAAKRLLGEMGPFTLAGLLYLGAAIAVAPSARSLPMAAVRDSATSRRLAGAVVLGGIVGPVLLMLGLRMASASSVSIWLSLETVFTAVLARWLFREHLGRRAIAALALVVLASAMLARPSADALSPAALLVAGACLAWGIDNNLMSLVDGVSPAQSTLVKGLVAGSVSLAIGLAIEGPLPVDRPLWIAGALAIGALAYGLSLVLYVGSSQQLGATRSQALFSTAPFWGVAVSWLALGEPIGWTTAGAATVLAIALAALPREGHAHRHSHARMQHAHWHRHDDAHHDHVHEGGAVVGWHSHPHEHAATTHEHPHEPDLHHRHDHDHDLDHDHGPAHDHGPDHDHEREVVP